jgi:hypothetical protein
MESQQRLTTFSKREFQALSVPRAAKKKADTEVSAFFHFPYLVLAGTQS